MHRRDFIKLAGVTVVSGLSTIGLVPVSLLAGNSQLPLPKTLAEQKRDFSVRIAPMKLELAPGRIVDTIGYNGMVPGPLLRVREGERVMIDVRNDSDVPELVHWHGLKVPSDVDGAMEEGTPMISPGGAARYTFVAQPSGTRWYHTHAVAGKDLRRSLYSGQYGFFYIEPRTEAGNYDQEAFIALHQWEPYFVSMQDLKKGPPPNNGLEVMYRSASFNDKALGHGEPIRVKEGERVMFRILNASATDEVSVALPGHSFTVIALDGNPIRVPRSVPVLTLAPAERIDAIVDMDRPGVWAFGSTDDDERAKGWASSSSMPDGTAGRPGRHHNRRSGITPPLAGVDRLPSRIINSPLCLRKFPADAADSTAGRSTENPFRTPLHSPLSQGGAIAWFCRTRVAMRIRSTCIGTRLR